MANYSRFCTSLAYDNSLCTHPGSHPCINRFLNPQPYTPRAKARILCNLDPMPWGHVFGLALATSQPLSVVLIDVIPAEYR
ncbi:MAG: hypothetical protein ACK47Z_11780 [Paracoccaceae bacterium]